MRIVGLICIAVIIWLFLVKPEEPVSGASSSPATPDFDKDPPPDGTVEVGGENIAYRGVQAASILAAEKAFLAAKQTADDAGIEEPLVGARPNSGGI